VTLAEVAGIDLRRREVEMCGADGVLHRAGYDGYSQLAVVAC
jgi:hypothetical protein